MRKASVLLFAGFVICICLLYIYIYRHISADDTVINAVFRKLIHHQSRRDITGEISPRPDSCEGCFKSEYDYIVTPSWKCPVKIGTNVEDTEHYKDVYLVIVVSSLVTNTAARNAVRSTWGSAAKNNTGSVRVVFLLGKVHSENNENIRLELEGNEHQDIVQADFTENYDSLTVKTMMGLKWATHACPSALHVMKTDDDVWVNIPALLKMLEYHRLGTTIGGHCYFGEYPRRINNNSKWYVSYQDFAGEVYPDYCAGVGYVMAARVAKEITGASKDVPYFKMEDVYVGLCAQKLGFDVKSLIGFYANRKTNNMCELKMNHIITSHAWKPKELLEIWNDHSHCSGLTFYGQFVPTKTIYIGLFILASLVLFIIFKRRRKCFTSIFKKR